MSTYDTSYRPGISGDDYQYDHRGINNDFEDGVSDDGSTYGTNNLLSKIGDRAAVIGGSVVATGKQIFVHQRHCVETGEGPTLLRIMCFSGGVALLSSSVLSLINIFSFLIGPSTYVLQLYQGFFGIITMIIEAKEWDVFDRLKPFLNEWFKFLSVPAGRGAFYLFIGSLGVSLWVRNLLAFTVGLYMAFMGIFCIGLHYGLLFSTRPLTPGGLSAPVISYTDIDDEDPYRTTSHGGDRFMAEDIIDVNYVNDSSDNIMRRQYDDRLRTTTTTSTVPGDRPRK